MSWVFFLYELFFQGYQQDHLYSTLFQFEIIKLPISRQTFVLHDPGFIHLQIFGILAKSHQFILELPTLFDTDAKFQAQMMLLVDT